MMSGFHGFRIGRQILPAALALLLGACASQPPSSGAAARNVVDPPRSSRGNPPFYEVFGQRYHVLETSTGYRERGIASWYGRDFHGKTTSGGELYDMHGMTAAHKSLPIPTWVEVRNLRNGRRVIVRVNDRGPFVDDRIIDLSYRAAQELDMVDSGTAPVEVRALGAPSAGEPVLAAAEARESGGGRGFSLVSDAVADTPGPDDRAFRQLFVQVGAFTEQDNASRLLSRLRQGGFTNSFVDSRGAGGGRLHRVRIGPLESAEQYDRINAGLDSIGVSGSRLVVDP